jgi:vacuolar protein sorting-associated protein 53
VASAAILVLLRELENACESALVVLSRTSWANHNHVTGPSPFVEDLVNAVESFSEMIRPLVEGKKYHRNFFDKASGYV